MSILFHKDIEDDGHSDGSSVMLNADGMLNVLQAFRGLRIYGISNVDKFLPIRQLAIGFRFTSMQDGYSSFLRLAHAHDAKVKAIGAYPQGFRDADGKLLRQRLLRREAGALERERDGLPGWSRFRGRRIATLCGRAFAGGRGLIDERASLEELAALATRVEA